MAQYYYLICSLPMLHFGAKPPFSSGTFLAKCREFMTEEDSRTLSSDTPRNATAKKWADFDTALRNELVRARSARRHADSSPYLRPDCYTGLEIPHIVAAALRNPSILEAERILDEARWNALSGFECGHYFDADFLVSYGHKLRILERWETIRLADKERLLEGALGNA
jgi:hypothetical protein